MKMLSLAGRNFKEIYRDPLTTSLGIGMPALLLFLFTSIGKNAPAEIFQIDMLTPAVIVFSFSFVIMFSATLLVKDRHSAFLTRLLAAPLRADEFIFAYMLPFIPFAMLQMLVCLIIGIILGLKLTGAILLSLLIMVPVALTCIGIGMILGSLFTENQVAGVGSIMIITISLFSGAWMDLKMVGGIFERVGYALPFAHAIDAARAIINGSGLSDLGPEMAWVVGYMIVTVIFGIAAFRWKTRP
jgi:ABC-2 type transport system permease protein